MRRSLLLLLLPLAAVAAPVPKETEAAKMKRLFGEVADAKKGYDFALDGDKLMLTMAAGASDHLQDNTPRIGREVSGDFEATVVVTLAPPMKNIEDAGKLPYLAAGLAVWGDKRQVVKRQRLFSSLGRGRKAANADGWESAILHWDYSKEDDQQYGGHAFDNQFQTCDRRHLRIRREGGKLDYADSMDGKTWKRWAAIRIELPDDVHVGVVGLNTTSAECTATFSDFTVMPLKPVDKK
jgi:hypothetical protein